MVVTRFAPSPTGYLHIGGARTALFCYLLARHEKGRMILRIEDTDLKRNTPTAAQQVINDLAWLGIEWDQGPQLPQADQGPDLTSKGDKGPYLQSQRRDIYDRYLQQLLDAGQAYYCFDTPEEIDALRQQAVARKQTFLYPRPATFPSRADAEQARAQGRPVVVRFAMPDTDIVVQDVVRGEVRFPRGEFGDIIIQKSDGFPTYHFACVVDDELMGVTHIIRGQEHLMNTPAHQALQDALGFARPTYAHMSVTVSEGGGKLSKRERAKTLLKAIKAAPDTDLDALASIGQITRSDLDAFIAGKSSPDQPALTAMAEHLHVHLPEINVVDFFHSGYVPEALVNFIALLGWSTGDDREIMTIDQLVEAFDITRLNKTNSLFDRKKLIAFNTEHLRMLPLPRRLEHFKKFLNATDSPLAALPDDTLTHLLRICEGARTLAEIAQKSLFLVQNEYDYDPKSVKKVLRKPAALDLLAASRDALANLDDWAVPAIEAAIEALCQTHDVGMGKIAQPIRVAITGASISPPIADSLALLGKDRTLARLDRTLNTFTL